MAIPFQGEGIDKFLKGVGTGSDMFAKLMNARYNSSLHPSGDVANALYVEQLGEQLGRDHPQYLQAKAAHEMAMAAHQSLMDYRGTLQETAPFRATSGLGKSIAEGQGRGALDILPRGQRSAPQGAVSQQGEQYYDAEGQPVYSEDDSYDDEKAQAYEQDIAKKTTDPDARKRYLFAQNIDKTRERIDPKALLSYAGIEGAGRFIMDNALAQKGKAPEKLIAYNKALTGSKTLAKQVRQFYGDSIQPEMERKLTSLTNPATWYKTPDLAMAEFEAFNDILDAETETYKKAGTSPIHLRRVQQNQQSQESPFATKGRVKYNPMTGRLE